MTTRSLRALAFATPEDLRAYVTQRRAPLALVPPRTREDAPPEDDGSEDVEENAPVITYVDDAWELDGTSYATKAEALTAAAKTEWFLAAVGRKATIEGLAEPRWFDAAAVEDLPSAYDGSQVGEAGIDAMLRNLAGEGTAIPVDGGNVSEVHESVWNTAARAAGWIYAGVKLLDEKGRAHLYLYGALLPEVDEQLDAKHLLYGSIAFIENAEHRYTGEPIGARLLSYALTNAPFIDGLTPHAARSAPGAGRLVLVTRSRKNMTTPKKTRSNTPAQRGPMGDALKNLARVCGIKDAEGMNDGELAWAIYDAASALAQGAKAETLAGLAEQLAAAAGGTPDAEGAPKSLRAVEGLEGDALESFAADVVKELRRATGKADADPAALLEALRAVGDGALGTKDADQENAGEGGVAGDDAARARADVQRAENMNLRARVTELEALVAEHGKTAKRAAFEQHIDAQLALVKRQFSTAQRTELLDMAMQHPGDGKRLIDIAIRGMNTPPQGIVTAPGPTAIAPAAGEPTTEREALDAAKAEVLKSQPDLKGHDLVVASQRIAARKWRHLFDRTVRAPSAD